MGDEDEGYWLRMLLVLLYKHIHYFYIVGGAANQALIDSYI
jgi:hypothetical protein